MHRGRKVLPFRRRLTPSPTSIEEVGRQYRRLQAERAAAADGSLDRILDSTPVELWHELVERPEFRTFGALEYLNRVFAETLHRDVQRAHVLAQLGVSLSENLPEGMYPPVTVLQARIYAWKDLGTALRFLSRCAESVEALQTAESMIHAFYGGAGAGALTHDLAIIRYSLAVTYQDVERFTESRELLTSCKAAFREHGDDQRYILCGFAEGVLLQRLRHYREARETYLLLLATARNLDPETLAALHHTIALCCVELGDFAEAEANFAEAVRRNRRMGKPVEILKIGLGEGRLMIRQGDHLQAIDHLRRVRRGFLRNAMPEEAGIAGLEIVEALLVLGRTSEAETLARKLVREFIAANLSARAITALGYLNARDAFRMAKQIPS